MPDSDIKNCRSVPQAGVHTRGKTVTELYRDFEKAHEAYNAIPDAEGKRQQRALEKASVIGRRAIETPTNRPEEMLLKIRLCLWFMGVAPYKKLEDLDRWRPGPQLHREIEHDTLAALRDDLHRLASRCANLKQPPSRRVKV